MRFFLILSVVFAGFTTQAVPAMAQEASLVKSGQTVLNISASERQNVQQDLLIASLRYETEGQDSAALQSKINTLITKALEAGKKYKDVQIATDHYYVYPYDPNQHAHPDPEEKIDNHEKKPVVWRGSQGLNMKSKNSADLLKLLGELQAMGMQTNNLSYTLSPESFETVRDGLMESALTKLREKAERAAKALGKKEAELVEVNVDTAYPNYPMPMMARAEMGMQAMDMKAAAPVASPGDSEITLTVSARAVLK
jgi:predicted secreted protein